MLFFFLYEAPPGSQEEVYRDKFKNFHANAMEVPEVKETKLTLTFHQQMNENRQIS